MGQYFIAVNTESREFIHPHRFGDGLKFFEVCGSSSGFLAGLALLLKKTDNGEPPSEVVQGALPAITGSWAGCKVTLIGDYDSEGLYQIASEVYKDVSFDVIRVMAKDAITKEQLKHKLSYNFAEGMGDLMADADERAFYREIFDE